jgi:hypothetical protein
MTNELDSKSIERKTFKLKEFQDSIHQNVYHFKGFFKISNYFSENFNCIQFF